MVRDDRLTDWDAHPRRSRDRRRSKTTSCAARRARMDGWWTVTASGLAAAVRLAPAAVLMDRSSASLSPHCEGAERGCGVIWGSPGLHTRRVAEVLETRLRDPAAADRPTTATHDGAVGALQRGDVDDFEAARRARSPRNKCPASRQRQLIANSRKSFQSGPPTFLA
jgi:hypothetical protein